MVLVKKKKHSYTVISNAVIKDERLSWKARGIFAYLMSLPEDWNFHQSEIAKHSKDGKDSLRTGMNELQEFGYLKVSRERNKNGHFGDAIWILDDTPSPKSENTILESPMSENAILEDPQLQITNTTNYLDNKLLDDEEEESSTEPKEIEKPETHTSNAKTTRDSKLKNNHVEEREVSKIIFNFQKAGLPLAYTGKTFTNQVKKLCVLIEKTETSKVDALVQQICDTKIKTDALNYLIVALEALNRLEKPEKRKQKQVIKKRIEQGTDWSKKKAKVDTHFDSEGLKSFFKELEKGN